MSENIVGNALPTFGETDKANSNFKKSTNDIVPKKYDCFGLTERMGKSATSKHEISLFHNNEKTALREKYLNSLDVSPSELVKFEAMLNGMYNLAKRHAFDLKEGL